MFLKDSLLKIIFKNAFLSFIIRIAGVGLMFAAQAMLARSMGTDDFGVFIYALNVIPVFSLIAQSGFQSAGLRFIHEYQNTPPLKNGYMCQSLLIPSGIAILITALGWIATHFPIPEIWHKILSFGFWSIIFFTTTQIAQHTLRTVKKITLSQIFEQIGLPCLLLIIATTTSLTFQSAITFYGLIYAAITLITWKLAFANTQTSPTAPKEYKTRYWINTTFPLSLAGLANTLLSRLDVLFLGFFLTASNIAHYGVAARIAGLLIFGLAAINTITGPVISELYYQNKKQDLEKILRRIVHGSILIGFLGWVVLYIVGDYLLLAFGQEYLATKNILLILAAGQMLNLSAGPLDSILVITKNQKTWMKIQITFTCILATILWWIIPVYGITGAAYATSTTIIAMNIGLVYIIHHRTGLKII